MGNSRSPLSAGRSETDGDINDGTSVRAKSSTDRHICVAENLPTAGANGILKRILKWRSIASATGFFPGAVKALDHYLDRTGSFVEIPAAKVEKVRKESESSHMEKMKGLLKIVPMQEAALAWDKLKGFPVSGGKLKPDKVEVTLEFMSGVARPGLNDDNLEYYGTMIHSEVLIRVQQKTIPQGMDDGPVTFELSIVKWKSWAVDNYDWEGDKEFGFLAHLGLPSQMEMNSLQTAGLAKSYQRSSRSWEPSSGVASWTEPAFSLRALQTVAPLRAKKKAADERSRQEECSGGALPIPRPAEEMSE